jgi:site-specific DNA-methyltransferase (adenine-specific)/modification methylase
VKPYYEENGIVIFNSDCREILPTLPKVDLVLTDPPYGINACNMTLGNGKKDFHRGDWDKDKPDLSWMLAMESKLCVWGGNYFTDVLPPTNHWLVWHKVIDGVSFSECELAWTNYGCNVRHLSHHWAGEQKLHPTMKPLGVISWALSKCPGDVQTVLDPFMGSGTTLVACKQAGLRCTGIEREERYCEVAANRLRQGVLWGAE